MNSTIITVAAVAVAIVFASAIILMFSKGKKPGSASKNAGRKDRASIIRSAMQKLAQNPRDIHALATIGDLYYEEENWEKAFGVYNTLVGLIASNPGKVDEFQCKLRHGVCSLRTGQPAIALKSLESARSLRPSSTEANYQLGSLYFMQKEYDKAITMLRIAAQATPQNPQAIKYLGIALQKTNHYAEALQFLRKVLDAYPGDKELLFAVGECFYETGKLDNALKVFMHLRADPVYGPQSALNAGMIHAQLEMNDKAAEDFEIGLKHQNVPQDIYVDIRYRYALLLLKMQDIARAMTLLKEIRSVQPGYKDTTALIQRYQELNTSRNLQVYLLAGQSEFILLCRRIVQQFYKGAKVKITETTTIEDYVDIVTEIDTAKWADIVIFRFFRSQSTLGEIPVRDLYGRIKELKAGRGVCFTGGTFSEGAKQFVEGRPIDLYGREGLRRLLDRLGLARKAAKA